MRGMPAAVVTRSRTLATQIERVGHLHGQSSGVRHPPAGTTVMPRIEGASAEEAPDRFIGGAMSCGSAPWRVRNTSAGAATRFIETSTNLVRALRP